jgi:hypothetical protein
VGTGAPDANRFFSDAACTQPEAMVEVVADPCTPAPGYAITNGSVMPDCQAAQVQALTRALYGRPIYTTDSGACAPPMAVENAVPSQLLSAGKPLALSTFVTLTATSE